MPPGRTSSCRHRGPPRPVRRPRGKGVLRAPRRSPRSPPDRSSDGLRASPPATVFGTVTPTMTVSAPEGPKRRLAGLRRRYEPQLDSLRGSDTAKAAGLAGAMIANNVLALISTVVFARLLNDYGSLAALISYFLILSVAGQAIQLATAREGVLGRLGVGPGLIATLRRWTT